MSRVCEITGKKPGVGNRVSHANNKKRRRFLPNLHTQRFWVETEKRWVSLRISANGLRTIEKKGIDRIVAELRTQARRSKAPGSWRGTRCVKRSNCCRRPEPATSMSPTKNKRLHPDKLEVRKFDPVVRKHVGYKETKIK